MKLSIPIFAVSAIKGCPELDLPESAMNIVYTGSGPTLKASVMCDIGFLAGGTKHKQEIECVGVDNGQGGIDYHWNGSLPTCQTCSDPKQEIQGNAAHGDEQHRDVFCSYADQAMQNGWPMLRCEIRCYNDDQRLKHSMMPGTNKLGKKTQRRANITCRCRKGVCKWTSHGVFGVDLSGEVELVFRYILSIVFNKLF